MYERLIHDHAFGLGLKLVGVVRPCLRDEEAGDALKEFDGLAREWMRKLIDAIELEHRRLNPLEAKT